MKTIAGLLVAALVLAFGAGALVGVSRYERDMADAQEYASTERYDEARARLDDAQRYVEAIPYYQQAFALLPTDINVSTDLGTALWYAGRPDEALAQYEKSLALNATHAQTLFNAGIVRADGKHDYAGAVAAWDTLLKTNPTYPDVIKVRSLMADAQAKVGKS